MTGEGHTDHTPQDVTPNDRLRELVEEWVGDMPDDPYRMAFYHRLHAERIECARELKELIEDDQ